MSVLEIGVSMDLLRDVDSGAVDPFILVELWRAHGFSHETTSITYVVYDAP